MAHVIPPSKNPRRPRLWNSTSTSSARVSSLRRRHECLQAGPPAPPPAVPAGPVVPDLLVVPPPTRLGAARDANLHTAAASAAALPRRPLPPIPLPAAGHASAGDCDPLASAPAWRQPLLLANAVQRFPGPLGVVDPLEGGEAQGGVTDGWRRAAPTAVPDDAVGSAVTAAEGSADHAAASQGGGAAGDAERFGSCCWTGRRGGVGHRFRVCGLAPQLIRCKGCGRMCGLLYNLLHWIHKTVCFVL